MKRSLLWFTNDLRIHDNAALHAAAQRSRHLLCVYVIDTTQRPYGALQQRIGTHRLRFLRESLNDLDQRLRQYGQQLLVMEGNPFTQLAQLIRQHQIQAVFASEQAGLYERQQWQRLQQQYRYVEFCTLPTHTLLQREQLPFMLTELPATFSQFRRLVEPLSPPTLTPTPATLPPSLMDIAHRQRLSQPLTQRNAAPGDHETTEAFRGGESAALSRLQRYFSSPHPAQYKHTRNALDDWNSSTKFSPWLANGGLSVRILLQHILDYEQQYGANQSTYWIKFELLWREYFQWYAHCHGDALFAFTGIRQRKPLTCFYPERFRRWCNGNTPYPIVNACMNQLNATGYLSNRGRQLVASALVNELQLDWRHGAAYFEQQLIDYDVASNWGNWQYLAGVGADTREKRHFNLEKQTMLYDPDGAFIRRWAPDQALLPLDMVDAADWPVTISGDRT